MVARNIMKLRQICINNNFFTGGTNEQYEEMFKFYMSGASLDEVATFIWIFSPDTTLLSIKAHLFIGE